MKARAYIFRPTNEPAGRFEVDSIDSIQTAFDHFSASHAVAAYDYLECAGRTWTAVPASPGLRLEEGRVLKPSESVAPSQPVAEVPQETEERKRELESAMDRVASLVWAMQTQALSPDRAHDSLQSIGPGTARAIRDLFSSALPQHVRLRRELLVACAAFLADSANGEAEAFLGEVSRGTLPSVAAGLGNDLAKVAATDFLKSRDPLLILTRGFAVFTFQVLGLVCLVGLTQACFAAARLEWEGLRAAAPRSGGAGSTGAVVGWALAVFGSGFLTVAMAICVIRYPFRVASKAFASVRYGLTLAQKRGVVLAGGLFGSLILGGVALFTQPGIHSAFESAAKENLGTAEAMGRDASQMLSNPGVLAGLAFGAVLGGFAGWIAASGLPGVVPCPRCECKRTRARRGLGGNVERVCDGCGVCWKEAVPS